MLKWPPYIPVLAAAALSDGDSAEHVAFGGPILYAHEGESLHEKPDHPSNVFWYQALEANKLYQALDARHRALALMGAPGCGRCE